MVLDIDNQLCFAFLPIKLTHGMSVLEELHNNQYKLIIILT